MIKNSALTSFLVIFLILFFLQASHAAIRKDNKIKIVIPDEVVESLKEGDISSAVKALRLNATSTRSKYLLREVERINNYNKSDDKWLKKDLKALFNVGTAYHNLFLFLKTKGYISKDFFNKARRFYYKSSKTVSPSQRNKIKIVIAALHASYGKVKKAKRIFKKADPSLIYNDFQKDMTLALYFASIGNADMAVSYLKNAHHNKSNYTEFWLGISDDFYNIENDPLFIEIKKRWNIERLNKGTPSLSSSNRRIIN